MCALWAMKVPLTVARHSERLEKVLTNIGWSVVKLASAERV